MSEIVFIGTSDAFGAGGRRQSAVLVRGESGTALVDCGATTGSGLQELGIPRDEIDSILISHFHGDHFGGIPMLLLGALYEDERKHPLRIAGPPGIEGRVRRLADAMGFSMEGREWSFPIHFQELNPGQQVEVGPAQVRAFETHHSPESVPHGLRIRTGREDVAYSGDTGWFEGLPGEVAGAHLFICECTYHEFEFEYHMNHRDLVKRKDAFDVGRILLTHLGAEMADRRGQGELETADDGLKLRV